VGWRSGSLEELVNTINRRALIFDLDGTLVDSAPQIGKVINETRVDFGFVRLSNSQIHELIGLPIQHFLSDLGLSQRDQDRLIKTFREKLLIEIRNGNELFRGVKDFLVQARSLGFITGIATSKPTFLAQEVVIHSDLNGLIDDVQGTDNFPPKPNPEVLIRSIKKLNATKALMIGDRIEDICAANAAGIPSIGVSHSFHSNESLLEAGANLAISEFRLLKSHVNLIKRLLD
jgi:phosphoglycolate phosphatase